MSRGIGEFGPIHDVLPEWMAVVLGLVTQLGDVWFLSLVVAVLYWSRSRRHEDVAVVAAMTLTGFAVIDALKRLFALPRPDRPLVQAETLPQLLQPLYEATGTAGGYGFPSGHAFMTTIVYLSLVDVLSIGTRRHRLAGAVALVATVSLTRVALGVHYLVDVVAGVGFGLAVLVLAGRLTAIRADDRATIAFGLAVLASGLNLLSTGPEQEALLLVGASLGTFGGWQLVLGGRILDAGDRPSAVFRPLLGRLALAGLSFAPIAVALEEYPLASAPARAGALGALTAIIVTLPVLRQSERARRVGTALAFWARAAALGIRQLVRPATWRRIRVACRRVVGRLRAWLRARRDERP